MCTGGTRALITGTVGKQSGTVQSYDTLFFFILLPRFSIKLHYLQIAAQKGEIRVDRFIRVVKNLPELTYGGFSENVTHQVPKIDPRRQSQIYSWQQNCSMNRDSDSSLHFSHLS